MIKETNWNEPRHDKTNKMSVRPAKTQISLGIRPVWSESLLCIQWVAKDPSFLHVDSEDSDQTGRMPRLIWVFAGCTATLLVLSCGAAQMGSFHSSAARKNIVETCFNQWEWYCIKQRINELPHDKTNKMTCAQQRLGTAWASAISDSY